MSQYKQLEINWSYSERNKVESVELNQNQIIALSRYMSYAILRTEKQLERWENHPTDDGQVTYKERRANLKSEINFFKELLALGKELKTK